MCAVSSGVPLAPHPEALPPLSHPLTVSAMNTCKEKNTVEYNKKESKKNSKNERVIGYKGHEPLLVRERRAIKKGIFRIRKGDFFF